MGVGGPDLIVLSVTLWYVEFGCFFYRVCNVFNCFVLLWEVELVGDQRTGRVWWSMLFWYAVGGKRM